MFQGALYDFEALKSSYEHLFLDKIDTQMLKIDTLRGICTASAALRLHKRFTLKAIKTETTSTENYTFQTFI